MGRCGTVAQDVENSGGSLKIGRSGFYALKIIRKYAVEGNLRMLAIGGSAACFYKASLKIQFVAPIFRELTACQVSPLLLLTRFQFKILDGLVSIRDKLQQNSICRNH